MFKEVHLELNITNEITYVNSAMNLLLYGIFLFKILGIISTQTTDSTSRYDITTTLNASIIEIFQQIDSNKIAESLQSYKGKPEDKKYETANTRKLIHFGDKLYFENIKIKILNNLELTQQIQWEFLTNKIRIFYRQLSVSITGCINKKPNTFYMSFDTTFLYTNVSIIAEPISSREPGRKIKIEFLPEESSNSNFHISRVNDYISYDEKSKLRFTICTTARFLIRNHFNNNDLCLHILSTVFSLQPKQKIILAHPDFLQDYDQKLHYYFIPTISHSGLTLNQITLKKFSNFKSFKVKETIDHSIYTLIVEKLQGRLNLDRGIQIKPIELYFTVDCLFITVERESKQIRVDARNYFWTSSKSPKPRWLDKYSKVLMHMVENGIAASIMPSMQVLSANELYNGFDMETSINQMLTEITQPRTSCNLTPNTNNTKPYNYLISFKDMTIKITSASPCSTKQIQCKFLKNLQIDYLVNAIPIKQIQTKPGSPIAINFHGNFTSVKLAVMNSNDTRENNTCELEIENNHDIDIELLPTADNKSSIKKKIDGSLLSIVKERITRNIIPLICYPINICDQAMKIVDDYFENFIDGVLRICSLRKNTTTT